MLRAGGGEGGEWRGGEGEEEEEGEEEDWLGLTLDIVCNIVEPEAARARLGPKEAVAGVDEAVHVARINEAVPFASDFRA